MKIRFFILAIIIMTSCAAQHDFVGDSITFTLGKPDEPITINYITEDSTYHILFQSNFQKRYTFTISANFYDYLPYIDFYAPEDWDCEERKFYYGKDGGSAVLYISTCKDRLPSIEHSKVLQLMKENIVNSSSAYDCERKRAFELAKTGIVIDTNCFCDQPNIAKGTYVNRGRIRYWKDYRIYNLVIGYYNATYSQKKMFDNCIKKTMIDDF